MKDPDSSETVDLVFEKTGPDTLTVSANEKGRTHKTDVVRISAEQMDQLVEKYTKCAQEEIQKSQNQESQ